MKNALIVCCALSLAAGRMSAELLVNGDFEGGNAGFTSDYNFARLDSGVTTFDIVQSPSQSHFLAATFGDHTSGTGLMLAVNGSTHSNDVVWRQTVSVATNAAYQFSGWTTPCIPIDNNPARIRVSINGTPIMPAFQLENPPGQWLRFSAVWNSGTNPVAVIELRDEETAQSGNDLALDDLRFSLGGLDVFVDGQLPTVSEVVRRGSATITVQNYFTNGTVLYTLDGSAPSLASELYAGPFTVTASSTVRAVAYSADFTQQVQTWPLTVVILPTLATVTAGGGTVAVAPPDGPYFSNSMASVTATPAPGWTFLQWLGDASGSNPVASVQMTRNKHVQAVFGTTVGTAIVGSGTISQTPVAPFYPYGSQVRFSALPNAGQYLSFWGNAVSSTDNPLTFVVTNANPTVTAVFQSLGVNQFALALVAAGKGTVTANPVANRFSTGESVTLTAAPDAGQNFIGWSGDASGTNNPLGVTMNQSKTITANFTKRPTLRVSTPLEGLVEDGFRLTLFGEFGTPYTILGSTNLHDWQVAGAVTNTYGTVQFVDPDGTNSPQKFYRATPAE